MKEDGRRPAADGQRTDVFLVAGVGEMKRISILYLATYYELLVDRSRVC